MVRFVRILTLDEAMPLVETMREARDHRMALLRVEVLGLDTEHPRVYPVQDWPGLVDFLDEALAKDGRWILNIITNEPNREAIRRFLEKDRRISRDKILCSRDELEVLTEEEIGTTYLQLQMAGRAKLLRSVI